MRGQSGVSISSSSNWENSKRINLEFDKELFLSEVSKSFVTVSKTLENLVTIANYLNKVSHGLLLRTAFC